MEVLLEESSWWLNLIPSVVDSQHGKAHRVGVAAGYRRAPQ